MSRPVGVLIGTLALVAAFILGAGVGEHRQKREDSNFVVTPAESCVPKDGWTLTFDYNGVGKTYITILPPTEEQTSSKEKKK